MTDMPQTGMSLTRSERLTKMSEGYDNLGAREHLEHEREEAALHEEHVKEEHALREVDEKIEHELRAAEEAAHERHVREEETLHKAHEQEERREGCGSVTITIDGKPIAVERGVYTIENLKSLGGIALAYTLVEERGGKLVTLEDSASVDIKGGEIFHSRVKSGGSS